MLEVIGRQEASGCQEEWPDPKIGEDDSSDENVKPFLGFGVMGRGTVSFDYEGPGWGRVSVETKQGRERKRKLTRMSDRSDAV